MWTEITRPKYDRVAPRYASDLIDAEWALIAPCTGAQTVGPPAGTDLRAVLDAILYIARTGCQWHVLPKDFPHRSPRCKGILSLARQRFVRADQFAGAAAQRAGLPAANRARRPGSSTANRSRPPRAAGPGLRCRQEDQGPQRHVVTDTSVLVGVVVHPADIQDRDGAGLVIEAIHDLFPGCAASLPTVSTTVPTCVRRWSNSAIGRSRSSNAPRRPPGFSCCRVAGWSNAPWPG